MNNITTGQIIAIAVILLLALWFTFSIIRVWLKALLSGVRISPTQILLMRLRGTDATLIVNLLIVSAKSGVHIPLDDLEACALARGDVKNVVEGLIYAKHKGLDFTISDAMKLEFEKQNIVQHLQNKP